jgi:Fic family protein
MNNIHIKIPEPVWGSNLAGIILDLEKLRTKHLFGKLPPHIFFQLKDVFQFLETLGSARIEGNNTTLSEYVDRIIEGKLKKDEKDQEIKNIEKAIEFIETNTNDVTRIDRAYISEIHRIITKNLTPPQKGEGSRYPGELRKIPVSIKNSKHKTPDSAVLQDYFNEFIRFINDEYREQYQLLMVSVAHHRFAYIHPFDNGNGRMGRLLNYAFLIKLGFRVKNGRILNPSSVFYANRNKYYQMLAKADSLKDNDILAWCEYFLSGLKNEVEKIDSLLDRDYVQNKILFPALRFALDNKHITEREYKILHYLVSRDEMQIKSEELEKVGITGSVNKSRVMARLKDKNIVHPIKEGGRIYTISFVNNILLRGVVENLTKEGFVSDFLNRN